MRNKGTKLRIRMSKKLLLCIYLLVGIINQVVFLNFTNADENFTIVMRVNDDAITNYDVSQRKKIYEMLNVSFANNSQKIKDTLVEEKLKFQYAKLRHISVSTEEIENAIIDFLKVRNATREILENTLTKKDISRQSFENYIAQGVLWRKAILTTFRNKIKITESQVIEAFLKMSLQASEKVELSEIVIPVAKRGKNNTLLLAKRLTIELNSGANFEAAVKRFSKSKTASAKGKIGVLDEAILPPNVKSVISLISTGDVSDPVVIGDNVVIFKLDKRIKTNANQKNDPLVTFLKVNSENVDGVGKCIKASNLKEGPYRLSTLGEDVRKVLVLATMFEPTYTSEGVWLILCSRKLNIDTNLEQDLKNRIFNQKMKELSDKLILKLHREATIQ